jgi:hypothetical protein
MASRAILAELGSVRVIANMLEFKSIELIYGTLSSKV